jgi:hypothetical protein
LPVVLYECKNWSLTLKEECRVRVFENRVPRRIIGPKLDEIIEGQRKLCNEELRHLYSSSNIIRMMCRKEPLGKPRCRWKIISCSKIKEDLA